MKEKINIKVLISILAAVLVVAVVLVLITIEDSRKGTLDIINDTSYELAEVVVGFVDEEGDNAGSLFADAVHAHDSFNGQQDVTFSFYNRPCELYVSYRIEGHDDVALADGYFTSAFDGNITVKFYEKNGKVYLKLKASEGLFADTSRSNLDYEYELLVDEDWYDYAE